MGALHGVRTNCSNFCTLDIPPATLPLTLSLRNDHQQADKTLAKGRVAHLKLLFAMTTFFFLNV